MPIKRRPAHRRPITRDEFVTLAAPFIGLPITFAGRGGGTCLLIEAGPQDQPVPNRDYLRSATKMMMQWSWRVESARAIRFGSWSRDRKMENGIATLVGRTILEIGIEGRLPELRLALSGGLWISTFMTAEGQPSWAAFLPDGSWLTVERGLLIHDTQNVGVP